MRKIAALTALGFLLVAGVLLLTEGGRSAGRAALLVTGLFAPDGATPLSLLAGDPLISDVIIATQGEDMTARLFEPTGSGPHGALILVAGYPSDIEDLQLSTLAGDLARLGIVALVPRLPALKQGRLSHDDVTALVDAFEWLAHRPGVAEDHIGFGGFCVGSSLILLAAEDTRINKRVKLLNLFGGYFDLSTFLQAVASRTTSFEGKQVEWEPAAPTVMLMAQNILDTLPTAADAPYLERYFVDGDHSEEVLASLSPSGLLAQELLTTTEFDQVERLLAGLPSDFKARLAEMSPSSGLDQLRAELFIMHDLSDPYIPVAESYRLVDALDTSIPRRQATFELFAHVRPRQSLDRVILIRDGVKLIGYLDDLLRSIMPS